MTMLRNNITYPLKNEEDDANYVSYLDFKGNKRRHLRQNTISDVDMFNVQHQTYLYHMQKQSVKIISSESRQYEIRKRKPASLHLNTMLAWKRNICLKLNLSKCIMDVFLAFILFSCCNSMCIAFHLNEESNSVYPKVKSISSSSFSHKRHSKTIEVFYQAGVSFYPL